METAKIIENDNSQVIRLPKKYRFACDEVCVQKVGKAVVLMPKESVWEIFMDGVNSFTNDFCADGRESSANAMREAL